MIKQLKNSAVTALTYFLVFIGFKISLKPMNFYFLDFLISFACSCQKAVELNESDATSHHLLGMWQVLIFRFQCDFAIMFDQHCPVEFCGILYKRSQYPRKQLRWRALQQQFTAFNYQPLLQSAPPLMFAVSLAIPLHSLFVWWFYPSLRGLQLTMLRKSYKFRLTVLSYSKPMLLSCLTYLQLS